MFFFFKNPPVLSLAPMERKKKVEGNPICAIIVYLFNAAALAGSEDCVSIIKVWSSSLPCVCGVCLIATGRRGGGGVVYENNRQTKEKMTRRMRVHSAHTQTYTAKSKGNMPTWEQKRVWTGPSSHLLCTCV